MDDGEYNEGEYNEGDDGLFYDNDADQEAEAVAKRLGDALWADISKAYTQQAPIQPVEVSEPMATSLQSQSSHSQSPSLVMGTYTSKKTSLPDQEQGSSEAPEKVIYDSFSMVSILTLDPLRSNYSLLK
ncbi:hypothetical protein K439DRAFT_1564907 [Ramaria rubella]|nr:hypothetical protein K439DRAFT_1564907 [Ramaria rubella]